MLDNTLGKKAEAKIKQWLDRPEEGYCIDRLKDQMTGHFGSKNICDFMLFKSPNFYYIESKSTWEDRFDFSAITDYQFDNMLMKSNIENVYGLVIILFASYKRAFIFNIKDIAEAKQQNIKSVNIKKMNSWSINYKEITTIPSRKELLDYEGNLEI